MRTAGRMRTPYRGSPAFAKSVKAVLDMLGLHQRNPPGTAGRQSEFCLRLVADRLISPDAQQALRLALSCRRGRMATPPVNASRHAPRPVQLKEGAGSMCMLRSNGGAPAASALLRACERLPRKPNGPFAISVVGSRGGLLASLRVKI